MNESKDMKEVTKAMALNLFGKKSLPRKAGELDEYAIAIVLVLKGDGKEYYAVQQTNEFGNLAVTHDFEGNSGIKRILEAYPVAKLKMDINGKEWKKCTRLDKIKYLLSGNIAFVPAKEYLEQRDDDELDRLCVRVMRVTEQRYYDINHLDERNINDQE